jgi:murein L,D-transpeptidase YcbB/YkuD
MERWRWMPDDLGPRYLQVNIPSFRLDVVENGASVLGMKVVVGKKENPTPVFADRMTSILHGLGGTRRPQDRRRCIRI